MTNNYEGRVELLGETLPFTASGYTDVDGTQTHMLTLHRLPILPSQLLDLMVQLAPNSTVNTEVDGIKTDMAQVMVDRPHIDHDGSLAGRHRRAFPEAWAALESQAQAIYDALPYRYSDTVKFGYGVSDLKRLILKTSDKTALKKHMSMYRRGEALAEPLIIDSSNEVTLPTTPYVVINDQNGDQTYIRCGNIRLLDDRVLQATQGFTPDGLGTVIFAKHQIYTSIPVWETHHKPNIGISPTIEWKVGPDGESKFQHRPPIVEVKTFDEAVWEVTSSSVIGSLVLAALSPEQRAQWRRREPLNPKTGKTQAMGPLQAILLSVIHADGMLASPLITHVEESLR